MDNEKEIQELKSRITSLEKQAQNKSQTSNVLKFILIFIIVIAIFFVMIGIYNYISVTT